MPTANPFATVARTVAVPGIVAFSVEPPVMFALVPPVLATLQVIVLLVAPAGFTVPESVSGMPAVAAAGTPVIPVTGTKEPVTAILKVLVYGVPAADPSVIVASTVAVPAAVALKILPPVIFAPVPPALATLHVMFWLVALFGATVPVSVSIAPAAADNGTPDMPDTGTNVKFTIISKS